MLAELLGSGSIYSERRRDIGCKNDEKNPPVYRPGNMNEHGTAFEILWGKHVVSQLLILSIDGRNKVRGQTRLTLSMSALKALWLLVHVQPLSATIQLIPQKR